MQSGTLGAHMLNGNVLISKAQDKAPPPVWVRRWPTSHPFRSKMGAGRT